MHEKPTSVMSGSYAEDEFYKDILSVTGGKTDEKLARMTIQASAQCVDWMKRQGVRFQHALVGTLQLGRTNAFFLGGGKAMMNAYYDAALRCGVQVVYDAEVVDVVIQGGAFRNATVLRSGNRTQVTAKAVVVAAGGFESNLQWLKKAWGPTADNILIRGTPYNQGKVIERLLAAGAQSVGDSKEGHLVAIDSRSPKFDGGIVTRLDCISLGIVVNIRGERFYDEGEDFWPKRYAIWGKLVADQPEQIAYCFFDAKSMGKFMPTLYPAINANSIAELAALLKLPVQSVVDTIKTYNEAVKPGAFNHEILDDCKTQGLKPEKTHWALKIDQPPFYAFGLRPGLTFTFFGLKVDEQARVLMKSGGPASNVFAAGESMIGNILGKGYVAGIGVTIGNVFGRIAGRSAAQRALKSEPTEDVPQEAARHVVG